MFLWEVLTFFDLVGLGFCVDEVRVRNANELITFSESVNSGTTYKGAIVYLNSDIDFGGEGEDLSQQFEPIGKDYINCFRGTFDGQGHVIRNLAINSANQGTGLFGFSTGFTVQNVVIDGSCSIVSRYESSNYQAFTGMFIGQCRTDNGIFTVSNSVNMAEITFNGNTNQLSFLGGIASALLLTVDNALVKNCANYGTVKNTGTSATTFISGVVGSSQGKSASNVHIQNCNNYGSLIHGGPANEIIIGGISGYSSYSTIDNCVNSGYIYLHGESSFIGNIMGSAQYSLATNCYWNSERGHGIYGYTEYTTATDSFSYNPTSFDLNEPVSIGNYTGLSLISALNAAVDYYTLRAYSHWALNRGNFNVSFAINGNKPSFAVNSQVILLPGLESEGTVAFDGWYTDSECAKPLADFSINSVDEANLHGLWGENTNYYTIFFDTRGGTEISPIASPFGSVVTLPASTTKESYEFVMWETEYGDPISALFTVPKRNITLYAVWHCTHIASARELVAFSKSVNSGTTYEGTTIYLDSDIDFSTEGLLSQFEPIGKDENNYFRGAFDGQGNVVKSLPITSEQEYVGLFGYSIKTTIRNVVIEDTCSVVYKSTSTVNVNMGGIIGLCDTIDGPCIIENSVNMAEVTFSGSTTQWAFAGGIAGIVVLSNYDAFVRNCANYETVKNIGISRANAYIGGIVGSPQRSSSTGFASYVYVQNCVNYGTLKYNGTTNAAALGGISGHNLYSNIDNCVSSGEIILSTQNIGIAHCVGGIAGYSENSRIVNCFWTKDVDCGFIVGISDDSTKTESVLYRDQLNEGVLDALNEKAKTSNLNKWTMLHLNGGKVNNLTQNVLVVAQNHFSAPVKERNAFVHWCTDYECSSVYDPTKGATGVTHLYAAWAIVYVVFSFLNGTTTEPMEVFNGEPYGVLPESESAMEGHSLCWFTSDEEGGKKVTPETKVTISNNHTLYGRWVLNNYTVTFDLGNGTVIENAFAFDGVIEYPGGIEMEGCTFNEWNKDISVMPAENVTIAALWIPNNYTMTFDLGNGTLIEEVFAYNETIKYPDGIEKEGCTLSGWSNASSVMPARNITIKAEWNCTPLISSSFSPVDKNKSKKSNTGAIVGGIVGGVVGVVVIILLVFILLLLLKKKDGEDDDRRNREPVEMEQRNPRIVAKFLDDPNANDYDDSTFVSIGSIIAKFYLNCYEMPTIADALRSVGINNEMVKKAVKECTSAGNCAENMGKLFDGFTKEDATAVALYTFDFRGNDFEFNPYRIINKALAFSNEAELRRASGLLYIVMCSLRKLPRCTGKTLYRGVRGGVDVSSYKEGSTVVWRGLSSTSPDMSVTKAFLAKSSDNGNVKGTLFVIENGWGYDIQQYSLFPEETEILLEPERRFYVQSVLPADLTVIKLQMLDTPLLLPEVFGGNIK